ncbi:MAG: hypothetical protein V4505_13395 [Pseudomonadota bacterium]
MNDFNWTPGHGVDANALERMRKHFSRPKESMGEAWFNTDSRRMFDELHRDLASISVRELMEPLVEIASGTGSFGPMPEWHSWYHYLLASLLPRSHECFVDYLLEPLITAFIAQYPNGIYRRPYQEFEQDVLSTLGRCMMDSVCWSGDDIAIGRVLHRSNNNPNKVWCRWDASGDLSASMFFCLKYLPEQQVQAWMRSVLAIPSPHWRAQILVWAVGAHALLLGNQRWPSEWDVKDYPHIGWDWSHCLRPELAASDESGAPPLGCLVPAGNRSQALAALANHFTEEVYLDWLASFSKFPYLEAELGYLPATFESRYVRR